MLQQLPYFPSCILPIVYISFLWLSVSSPSLPLLRLYQQSCYDLTLPSIPLLSRHCCGLPHRLCRQKQPLCRSLQALQSRGTRSCFECDPSSPDGVFVWPKPLQFHTHKLLLLKLRTASGDSSAQYTDIRWKLRTALATISAVCCLCEEEGQTIKEMDTFVQDYKATSLSYHLETSKLLVFANRCWLRRPQTAPAIETLRGQHGELFKIVLHGSEETSCLDGWDWTCMRVEKK